VLLENIILIQNWWFLGDPILRKHLILAYDEFIKDLNALAIVVCAIEGAAHRSESSALNLQISVEVSISRLQKLITAMEETAKRAKEDAKRRVQVKKVSLVWRFYSTVLFQPIVHVMCNIRKKVKYIYTIQSMEHM